MIAGEGACLVCGQPLEYATHPVEMECFFCHQKVQSYARCAKGHFICDKCHAQLGSNSALSICLRSASKNPVGILQEMMADPHVHMHGPEHHIMVGCALITAAHNAGASFDAKEISELLELENVTAVAEIMDFVGVIRGSKRMHDIIEAGEKKHAFLQGHASGLAGNGLDAYAISGIQTLRMSG